MIWLTEIWDDVESDLSAYHRIEDPQRLAGWRLMKLAARLHAYGGAVAFRLKQFEADSRQPVDADPEPAPLPPSPPAPRGLMGGGGAMQPLPKHSYTEVPDLLLPGPAIPGATVVPATPAALAVSDLGHLFSYGTG